MIQTPDPSNPIAMPSSTEKVALDSSHGTKDALVHRYSRLSVIAFAFTTTNSWLAFGSGIAVPLISGGGPALIYGLIVSGIVMATIGAGFAELASAFPSAGGQYHIVYMVFPPKYRRSAAFVTAWMSILSTALGLASCNFFVASSVADLAALWNPGYEPKAWQIYLLHVLLCVIGFVATSRFPGAIGRVGIAIFWLSLVGFAASIASVLAVSPEKQSASFVFKDYPNTSGWSDGFAFVLGVTGCLWAYSGVDGPTHLAEEVENPSRNVPIAIGLTISLGIVTVVVWNIALLFAITDLEAIVASGVPIIEVYRQSLNSKVGTTIFTIYYMVMFYDIVLNLFIFGGRIAWSLARDGGVPYHRFFTQLNHASPVRATAMILGMEIIVGILFVASSTAYNSFIGLTLFALNITVALPQAALLFRGRDCLPRRAFSLGKFGYAVNGLSTAFVILFSITFCFPTAIPVAPSSMNYLVVVMAGGWILIAIFWWAGLRRSFTGPTVAIDALAPSNTSEAKDEEETKY